MLKSRRLLHLMAAISIVCSGQTGEQSQRISWRRRRCTLMLLLTHISSSLLNGICNLA